jgi:histone H3/H4
MDQTNGQLTNANAANRKLTQEQRALVTENAELRRSQAAMRETNRALERALAEMSERARNAAAHPNSQVR